MNKVRVRFAPSPTGPLHMGGVRTALYNYLFAKKHGGDFLLRLEDTDQTRFVPGAEQYILDALKWCKIEVDEGFGKDGALGPYRQSERKPMYRQYADLLLERGHAYYAFDTPEELEQMRERMKNAGVPSPQYNAVVRESMQNSLTLSKDEVKERINRGDKYVIRVKMPRNEEVRIQDIIRGWVVVNTTNLDDKVIFKSDGMPTYHLANVVDDHLMQITHVIRGEEWLPSAPLHILLYSFFDWERPQFAHLPLILKPDGNGKLSKRDGDRLGFPVFPTQWTNPETSELSSGYREDGYLPEAFTNMLAFLGWNPGTSQEIFSMDELIQTFSLDRVGKAGAKFDFDKTKWFNQQYLREKDGVTLAALLTESVNGAKAIDPSYLAEVCELMKERATFIKDIWESSQFFFQPPSDYDEKTRRKKWKDNTPEVLNSMIDLFTSMSDFSAEQIETQFKSHLEKNQLGLGMVLPAFRLSVTGLGMGPSMFAISELLGKDEVIRRIKTAIDTLS
ncbi:MAG: glutamate--tRNA ligase [Rhodobacteraceae bacterium TMED111]|nr:MAG: glutamate--tRNA ligase [Rhodobacteraceae bacterium TMED111]